MFKSFCGAFYKKRQSFLVPLFYKKGAKSFLQKATNQKKHLDYRFTAEDHTLYAVFAERVWQVGY